MVTGTKFTKFESKPPEVSDISIKNIRMMMDLDYDNMPCIIFDMDLAFFNIRVFDMEISTSGDEMVIIWPERFGEWVGPKDCFRFLIPGSKDVIEDSIIKWAKSKPWIVEFFKSELKLLSGAK